MKEIGNRVRALREHRRWSQQDLAEKSKLQRPHISLIENGERTPGADSLIKLADALGTTTDYLLGLTNDPMPPPNPSALSRIERLAKDKNFMAFVESWEKMREEARKAFIDFVKHVVEHQSEE